MAITVTDEQAAQEAAWHIARDSGDEAVRQAGWLVYRAAVQARTATSSAAIEAKPRIPWSEEDNMLRSWVTIYRRFTSVHVTDGHKILVRFSIKLRDRKPALLTQAELDLCRKAMAQLNPFQLDIVAGQVSRICGAEASVASTVVSSADAEVITAAKAVRDDPKALKKDLWVALNSVLDVFDAS